jgi:hypothetical protein
MSHAPLVPPNWELPQGIVERLGTSVGRQRFMKDGDNLLVVTHEAPLADENARRGLLFWRDEGGEWRASNGDPGKAAIDNFLKTYAKRLDEFDLLEARAQHADEYLMLLDGLAPLVRSTRNLLNVLEEARQAFPKIRELIDFRDRAYDLSRTAELLYSDSKNSMEIAIVRRAEEQAESSKEQAAAAHRLNKLAALFFPLATLGTIFGTTFTENWSWSQTPLAFAAFIISGLVAGLGLAKFIARPIGST